MRDETVKLRLAAAGEATERPISIAIVAMGGQGGGVLTGWIVKLAEDAGWVAQSTSVPGVAQRTGATIYYVEMMQPKGSLKPVLAQMPTPGDVDVVLASEFVEAGRSILRGIVTPDRTTLIASSHRSFTIGEKSAPGEGIVDGEVVTSAIDVVARNSVIFDMDSLATKHGSVISSALFGALAAVRVLPFEADAYRKVITQEGRGVAASIATFDAAYEQAIAGPAASNIDTKRRADEQQPEPQAPAPPNTWISSVLQRRDFGMPQNVLEMARLGLAKVVDFQDPDYGIEYLDLLEEACVLDKSVGGERHDYAYSRNMAKYLANAMAYDDVIRVADLKTRRSRRSRISSEIALLPGQIFETTEYMHPRMEEIAGLAPARVGRWLKSRQGLFAWLDRRVSKGRRVRTYSPLWFLMLYTVAGLRRFRRGSLRHQEEVAHRDAWFSLAARMVEQNYALGVEVVQCQRLIKGYSDTHARGQSKFGKVTGEICRIAARPDAADWARRLRETAIRNEEAADLDGLIRTMQSFS